MNAKWVRVNKKRRCQYCGKGDWCTYSDEIGLALCMRVESDRPSNNSMGGWLHKTGEGYAPRFVQPIRRAIEDKPIDAAGMLMKWANNTEYEKLDNFGLQLGVDTDALAALGCAWAGRDWQQNIEKRAWATPCWAFPMSDAGGRVIGIRLRGEGGGKWSVKGSANGLFIPSEFPFVADDTLFLTEGPTDTAAGMTIGLHAIGRPSCSACDGMVVQYVQRKRVRRVVIVTDNDQPDKHGVIAGRRGAEKLQRTLPIFSAIWVPPVKDIREYVNLGGTRRMIEASVKDLVWTQPRSVAA